MKEGPRPDTGCAVDDGDVMKDRYWVIQYCNEKKCTFIRFFAHSKVRCLKLSHRFTGEIGSLSFCIRSINCCVFLGVGP